MPPSYKGFTCFNCKRACKVERLPVSRPYSQCCAAFIPSRWLLGFHFTDRERRCFWGSQQGLPRPCCSRILYQIRCWLSSGASLALTVVDWSRHGLVFPSLLTSLELSNHVSCCSETLLSQLFLCLVVVLHCVYPFKVLCVVCPPL